MLHFMNGKGNNHFRKKSDIDKVHHARGMRRANRRKEVALKLSEEKEMVPMLDKLIEELLKLNK